MLKNLVQLEHVVEGKIIRMSCDADTQLPHVKEALFAFMKYVGNIEDQVKAQQDKAKADAEVEPAKEAETAPIQAAEMPTPE